MPDFAMLSGDSHNEAFPTRSDSREAVRRDKEKRQEPGHGTVSAPRLPSLERNQKVG